jgi:hypothetical protein
LILPLALQAVTPGQMLQRIHFIMPVNTLRGTALTKKPFWKPGNCQ